MCRLSPATLFNQLRNQSRPTCLVARADPGPVVSVKILMELNQVAPVRIILKFLLPAIHRPAITIAQKNSHEPAGQVSCRFPEIRLMSRASRTFNFERVTKEVVKFLQGFHQKKVQREPDRTTPV